MLVRLQGPRGHCPPRTGRVRVQYVTLESTGQGAQLQQSHCRHKACCRMEEPLQCPAHPHVAVASRIVPQAQTPLHAQPCAGTSRCRTRPGSGRTTRRTLLTASPCRWGRGPCRTKRDGAGLPKHVVGGPTCVTPPIHGCCTHHAGPPCCSPPHPQPPPSTHLHPGTTSSPGQGIPAV